MAAANWKMKIELTERVASARRKARFARSAKTVAACVRARELVVEEMKRARQLKNGIEAARPLRLLIGRYDFPGAA